MQVDPVSPASSLNQAHPWALEPLRVRVAWVARFRVALARARDEFCRLMADEVGKPHHEALMADIAPVLAACRWHERHAARVLSGRWLGRGPLFLKGVALEERPVPLGRVAIIATWNYPVQLLGIQLVQALVSGNTVVVKPSEHAPLTQARLLRLAVDAGLPPGALAWTEATREAGKRLLDGGRGRFDHVVFTGSTAVGREIAAWAAPGLVPTTLELSGRDSALVLADADPALAARAIWQGVTFNAGQTCMAPRRALVDQRVYRAFLAALGPLAAGAPPRRLISEAAAKRVYDLCRAAIEDGGRSLSGVVEAPRPDRADRLGLHRALTPLAIVDCPVSAELVAGDHFGPALAVVPVRDVDEALAIHARVDQHLSVSVFTRRPAAARALAPRLRAGAVMVNDCVVPTAHPAASIGGVGASGWGLSRGEAGLLGLTRPVQVSVTSSWLRPPTAPPTGALLGRLSALVGWLYGAGGAGPAAAGAGVDANAAAGPAHAPAPLPGPGPGAARPEHALFNPAPSASAGVHPARP